MNTFIQKTKLYIEEHRMLENTSKVVVGLSGGADSVVLLKSLCELSRIFQIEEIIAVHVNHGIRGDEAYKDECFCVELCKSLGVEIRVIHADIPSYAKINNMSVEEAGRAFRYNVFNEIADEAEKTGFEVKIAIAHNANDVAETLLFNLVRGSSVDGLAGIKPVNDRVIRPILWSGRLEIEAFLDEQNQDYCTDSTNLSDDYSRNCIRHKIIPVLEEINPSAVKHINQAARDVRDICEHVDNETNYMDYICNKNGQIILSKLELKELSEVVRSRVIHSAISEAVGGAKDITREHVLSVASLLDMSSGKQISLPKSFLARNSYDNIIIEKAREKEGDDSTTFDNLEKLFKIEIKNNEDFVTIPKNNYNKVFDYDKIPGNVCVRTPQDDDYMIIDKAGHTKRLKRIFTDVKIDRTKRLMCPVIATGDEVLWAVGVKDSQGYLVSDDTKNVLSITYLGEI